MSVVLLMHPTGLLGSELRETLDRRPELWREVLLRTTASDEAGILTEVGGSAAMVTELEDGELERADVIFFCGTMEETRPLLERVLPATTAVLLAPDASPEDGEAVVAAVNLERATRGTRLLSPHPGAIVLAHVLHPLRSFRPQTAVATLLQPVSTYSREALDEIFEQARGLLTFESNPRREIFPVQMAFNVIPDQSPAPYLAAHAKHVLGEDAPELSVQVLQAGIFHGYGLSLHLELDDDPEPEEVREALGEHPAIELAVDPELLGMVDAAGRNEVIVGPVTRDPRRSGTYWIWAVMDNLTRGGAVNAVQILESVSGIVH